MFDAGFFMQFYSTLVLYDLLSLGRKGPIHPNNVWVKQIIFDITDDWLIEEICGLIVAG